MERSQKLRESILSFPNTLINNKKIDLNAPLQKEILQPAQQLIFFVSSFKPTVNLRHQSKFDIAVRTYDSFGGLLKVSFVSDGSWAGVTAASCFISFSTFCNSSCMISAALWLR